MHRLLILLLLALPVWAQDSEDVGDESTDTSPTETSDTIEQETDEISDDEEDLDELYAEEDEDAFIPSEDVKFGQSIPFPTDI
ncbi:MAG: hypothetical protein ACR2QI_08470 [Woeseiaceae bacterium]